MMTRKDFNELVKFCYSYDPYTMYIDNYQQEKSAETHNKELDNLFNELLQKYVEDYNHGVALNRFSSMTLKEIRTGLEEWLFESFGITVEEEKVWEASAIRDKVATDDEWALRGLIAIHRAELYPINNIHFDKSDKILSDIAKFYWKNKTLTDKQMVVVKKLLPKYAEQLARIANKDVNYL